MIINAADLDAKSAYKLLIGSIMPRPIAWVSTRSTQGIDNLAPISFFTAVGRKPPRVSLSIQPREDGVTAKDTLTNIRETGEFVVNLAVLPLADALHRSAYAFETDVDEFEELGLAKEECVAVKPPRVKESPISMECVTFQIFEDPNSPAAVVWGEVVRFHIRDDLYLENGRIDIGAIPAIGRLAGEYTLVENVFYTPVESEVLAARKGRRMKRLDGRDESYSPIDAGVWSPSGSTID